MNAQETLPTELRMSAPPAIPQARSYLFKQRSEYTEYEMGKGTKIRINIPRLQRTYLSKDSYLRFRLNVDVSATAGIKAGPLYLDRAGAYSLFDRMEVYDYLGGTLIEQVNNLPTLVTYLNDINTPIESFNSKLQATQGYEGSMVGYSASSLAGARFIENLELRTANSGEELISANWNTDPQKQNRFSSFEFSIPLMSFLGNFSTKFVPLHNGFSIDLFLNNVNQAFICYGANQTTITESPIPPTGAFSTIGQLTIKNAWLTNVEFCAQVMELGNDAENLVLASNGSGPLVIPSTFYRYFTDLVKGSGETDQTSTIGMDLNLNVVSLKNVRFGMRPLSWQNNLAFPAYGHRIRNFLETFSFRYGSSFLPELAGVNCRSSVIPLSKNGYPDFMDYVVWGNKEDLKLSGFTQSYVELLKTGSSRHWPDPTSLNSINVMEYQTDLLLGPQTVTDPTSNIRYYNKQNFQDSGIIVPPLGKFANFACGKFVAGLDLRLSSKDVVSGIDTNGLLVRLNANFDNDNLSNMVNAILDVYAEHDAFVQIIPGVATTVTF